MRAIKKSHISYIALLVIFIPLLANAETLSLSTSYPSPYGTYNRLRLVPQAGNPSCAGNDGLLWINATGDLKLCLGGLPTSPPDVWTQNDPTDTVFLTDFVTNPILQVGIGTITAATMLHIAGPAAQSTLLRLDSSSGAGVGMQFFEGVARRSTLSANATNAFMLADSADIQRFVITQAGNVGIGIPVPLMRIHANGNIRSQGNYYSGTSDTSLGQLIAFGAGAASTQGGRITLETGSDYDTTFNSWMIEAYQDDLRIIMNPPIMGPPILGNPAMYFDQAGNSAIYGVPIGINKLTVGGDLYVGTAPGGSNITSHVFYFISDEKLKENVRAVKGWDIIKQLNGVEFDWKATQKKGIGLIAQDVEKVLPELVNTDPASGLKTLQYGNLIAPLIETVKEQQAQIESLRQQIDTLKAQRF